MWFEEDALCVLFYRTDKLVQFNLDGSIRGISDGSGMERSPEFPLFSRQGRKFIFNGKQIDVVYDKRTFTGYWLFGAERYLAITPKNEEIKVVYAWTAKGIISEEVT